MTREDTSSIVTVVVIVTGAGISADSGLATFRAADGLWEGHRVENARCPTHCRH